MEQLSEVHLRYLLTIYEISAEKPEVLSVNIAERLKVTKPTVSSMLEALMDKHLLVKKRYGKVYLTDEGYQLAKRISDNTEYLIGLLAENDVPLDHDELRRAAAAAALTLPDREFFGK